MLEGRKIIVTGAASGIGAATASRFAKAGAALFLIDRDATALECMGNALSADTQVADISDARTVDQAVARAARALGGLDGLVNAAGIACDIPVKETTDELWDRVIGVNLTGTFNICRSALPHLKGAQSATVVGVSSASGLLPSSPGAAYGASKAGVSMFLKFLSRELAPNVRVNSVCPGMVDTPMLAALKSGAAPDELSTAIKANYALQRMATPDEIAEAILWLTSDASSFVTGISLPVDGGRTFH